jgi:hypothetical protein
MDEVNKPNDPNFAVVVHLFRRTVEEQWQDFSEKQFYAEDALAAIKYALDQELIKARLPVSGEIRISYRLIKPDSA